MPRTVDDRIVDLSPAERRQTFRMSQSVCDGTGKLRVGSRTVTVQLLDESSGGFMVAAAKIPKALRSQPVELITASGRHSVRVAWRRGSDGETRLGLQRLHNEIVWRDDSSWVVWMLVAIILGLGLGYFVALKNPAAMARKLRQFTSSKLILNEQATGLQPRVVGQLDIAGRAMGLPANKRIE